MAPTKEELKRQAATKAVESVHSGMVVGLGTGSTAIHAVGAIGRMLQDGRLRDVVGIPTSSATAEAAKALSIPLATLDDHPTIDLTIDGTDEFAPNLDLIKGLGGALLREKVVAKASQHLIVVCDDSKRVPQLGSHAPLPVEVIRFARRPVTAYLQSLGARVLLRPHPQDEQRPYLTDEGNYILDCHFGPIAEPAQLAQAVRSQPGVVEHGLFLGFKPEIIVASQTGIDVIRHT